MLGYYIHKTVRHKREFVKLNGVNTQAVKPFNNKVNFKIKRRRGIKTEKGKGFGSSLICASAGHIWRIFHFFMPPMQGELLMNFLFHANNDKIFQFLQQK